MSSNLLVLGLTIALEPLPVIAFIAVLSSAKAVRNGAAFILGWVVCLVAVIALAVAVGGGKPLKPSSAPSTAASVVTLVLGLALLGYGIYRRARPSTKAPSEPGWMKKLDTMSAPSAAVLGVLLQPWALVAAGGLTILHEDLSQTTSVLLVVAFVLLSTSVLLTMQGLMMKDPEATKDRLDRLKAWIERHREPVIVVLSIVAGAYLAVTAALNIW